MIELDCAGCVDRGQRKTNDDRALLGTTVLNMKSCSEKLQIPFFAAVCDGCGGYSGGDIAAEITLRSLADRNVEELDSDGKLENEFLKIAQGVSRVQQVQPEWSGMCTTVAGCMFQTDKTIVFHLGDSRVYRYDGHSLVRLTHDHSFVQRMIDCGAITEQEINTHPQRNIIERCIGRDIVSPDFFTIDSPIQAGDIYLICSDGLWAFLSVPEIREILSGAEANIVKCTKLIAQAMSNGSDDNISAVICERKADEKTEDTNDFFLD